MLRTLSEKLKALRTDRPDEWTMDEFMRDAVKLEKERDEALAKLAAMESQEPIGYASDTTIRRMGTNGYRCANICNSQSENFCIPVFIKPASADKPAVAVPEFLLEMSKQMREQPNRSTAHPFWQVRCKRSLVTEQGYSELGYEIISDDGVVYRSYASEEDELEAFLLEDYPEFCKKWCEELDNGDSVKDAIGSFDPTSDELPEGLRLVYVQEIEEVISTHLTEADANWFIRRKQHDYPKLYTYVESAYWSPQLKQLQDWIISLSAPSHSQQSSEK